MVDFPKFVEERAEETPRLTTILKEFSKEHGWDSLPEDDYFFAEEFTEGLEAYFLIRNEYTSDSHHIRDSKLYRKLMNEALPAKKTFCYNKMAGIQVTFSTLLTPASLDNGQTVLAGNTNDSHYQTLKKSIDEYLRRIE